MFHPVNWSLALLSYATAFTFGYLLGSIPFGLIVTRLAGTQDIRSIGSGNIGATNVLRTGRIGLAVATLLGDALKGTAAVLLTYHFGRQDLAIFAALGAFLGHVFPVWLRFKGGKGVATYVGILIAFAWPVAIAYCVIWLVIAATTRYSSLAGLTASTTVPVILWLNKAGPQALLFLVLTVALWIAHRANLWRLLNGTESKIGQSVPAAPP